MQSLEIEIDVNESYINRVQSGQPVEATLDAYPAWKIPCKVIAIIPTADRQKSTVRVRVAFDQLESRILPDMSIKVAFHESLRAGSPGPSAPGVTVPKAALRQQDGKDVVFVARNGQATRRAVTVDRADGDQVVIAAGIAPGEKVIIEPRTGLSDGLSIREQR
jgi:RND family efflux transporter MFP subunit